MAGRTSWTTTVAFALVVSLPTVTSAQSDGGDRRATARAEVEGARDTAGATTDRCDAGDENCDEVARHDLVLAAETAIRALSSTVADLVDPATWSGARRPGSAMLLPLSSPLGRLFAVIAGFGVVLWGVLNPARAFYGLAWLSGLVVLVLAERRGHPWLGMLGALMYWVGLRIMQQRSAARRRTMWGDA